MKTSTVTSELVIGPIVGGLLGQLEVIVESVIQTRPLDGDAARPTVMSEANVIRPMKRSD